MGVDSGLPDFRGNSGFWRAYPAIAKLGRSFAEMANPAWFEQDPHLAWAFYGHRLNLYRATAPHRGFQQLLTLGQTKPDGCRVITSNVDGQFQQAGFDPDWIEEVHGSIHHLQCTGPCSGRIWPAEGITVTVNMESFRALEPLPRCPDCGAMARPNILMFGDWGWLSQRSSAQSARLARWLDDGGRQGQSLVIVEIGAGLAVPTIRHRSETTARRCQGVLIRINPRDGQIPPGPHVSLSLGGAAGVAALVEGL
ncbi:MAG: NAD-dependent deacetylase [Magnetococcales bacterium]|nr:NAD-dependent deacetylase [Magnetococcales bacterium]